MPDMPDPWNASTTPAELHSLGLAKRQRRRRRTGLSEGGRLAAVLVVNLGLMVGGLRLAHYVVARFIAG